MKTRACFIVFSLLAFSCLAHRSEAQQPAKLLMGATGTASSHYVYSVAVAKAVNELAAKYMDITVVATGGAVDNLERLHRGQVQLGIGTFDTFFQAYHGQGKYEKSPRPKLPGRQRDQGPQRARREKVQHRDAWLSDGTVSGPASGNSRNKARFFQSQSI